MGTMNIANETSSTLGNAAAGDESRTVMKTQENPLSKMKITADEKVYWSGESADPFRHLTYQAIRSIPSKEALHQFEQEDFGERQIALAELRLLEKEVNLKTMPAAVVLVSVTLAVVGFSLKTGNTIINEDVTSAVISIFALVAAVAVLVAIRKHNQKEACLTAWTKAFEDSHARATKKEEEQMKADFSAFNLPAQPAKSRRPSVSKLMTWRTNRIN